MNIKSVRYLTKLIIFSLLVGVLPVITQGVFFYHRSSRAIQDKVYELNMQLLVQNQMRIEEILKSIRSQYTLFASVSAGQYMDRPLSFKEYDKVNEILKKLKGPQYIIPAIHSAYMVNFSKDWVIGNDSMGSFSAMRNKEQILKILENPAYSFWTYVDSPANTSVHMNISKQFPIGNICLIIKLPVNSPVPSGAIIVNISRHVIEQIISSKGSERNIIVDENGRVLFSSDASIAGMDMSTLPYIKKIMEADKRSGFFKANIDDERMGVIFRKSDYNGWIYLTFYSISDITKESRSMGITSVIICVSMILIVVVFSISGSNVMYKPINHIYQIMRNISDGSSLSGKTDEFVYIQEGMVTQLEKFFVLKLINGELGSDEFKKKMEGIGRKYLWDSAFVVTIQIFKQGDYQRRSDTQELAITVIQEILEKIIPPSRSLKPVLKKDGVVLLIGNEKDEQVETAKEFLCCIAEKIDKEIMNRLGMQVNIGVSSRFSDLDYTYVAYRQSIEALITNQLLGVKSPVLFFDEMVTDGYNAKPYPQILEGRLIDAINMGELDKAEAILKELIDDIFSRQTSINDIFLSLLRLMVSLIKIVQDVGNNIDPLFSDSSIMYVQKLYTLRNAQEAHGWFMDYLIKPIVDILEEYRVSQSKEIAENVISLIHQEYDTDITLESCAAKLNYHPSYIWKALRKEYNTTFSDYLSQYRLKIAKEWLRETDMSVAEIAERLRYSNSQNFIRFFKKMEGVTPGQYRNAYRHFKGQKGGEL